MLYMSFNSLYTGFTFLGLVFNFKIVKTYPKSCSLGFSCSKLHPEVKSAILNMFVNLAMPTN